MKYKILLAVLSVIQIALILLLSGCALKENASIQVCTLLRIYPVNGSPCCMLVNQGESVQIYKGRTLEKEGPNAWETVAAESHDPSDTFTLQHNEVRTYSLDDLVGAVENQPGHYQATFQNCNSDEVYSCEFWIVDDWQADCLDLREVLCVSPFESSVNTPAKSFLNAPTEVVQNQENTTATNALIIPYEVINSSSCPLRVGEECYVEIELDGKYYLTPVSGFDAHEIYLDPGQSCALEAYLVGKWTSIPPYDKAFMWPSGKYRLISPVTVLDISGQTTIELHSAELLVYPANSEVYLFCNFQR